MNAAYMLEAVAYCEKGNIILYVVEADFVVKMGKSFEVALCCLRTFNITNASHFYFLVSYCQILVYVM